jgi:hypothetical protein
MNRTTGLGHWLNSFLCLTTVYRVRAVKHRTFRPGKGESPITQLHTKVANIRKDFLHKVSNDISKNHAVV